MPPRHHLALLAAGTTLVALPLARDADAQSLRGSRASIDRMYRQARVEAAFHQAVIDAVTSTLLPAIRNTELKALVERVAPAFQGHMHAARQLEKNLQSKSSDRGR